MAQDALAATSPAATLLVSRRSEAYDIYLRGLARRTWTVRAWQAAILIAFVALWELAPRAGWVNPLLTSYPTAVFRTMVETLRDGSLLVHSFATLVSTVIGFLGGMIFGIAIALALWLSPMIYRVLDPFIVVINALPKIALVPIFYIWLGDLGSIYAMAIMVSVFVTVLMLFTGFNAIDPDKIKLVRLFGASRLQVLTKIVLPGSVPMMISTLKVNVGLALVGVVVGEFQSAKAGLGYLITYGSQIFQMNLVMTAIVALAVISTVLFGAIQLLEAFIARRRNAGMAG
jgi:NitT/TauT family transport system permease protein